MNKIDKSLTDRLPSKGRFMSLRAPSLCFTLAFAALSAQGQNSGATVDSLASDLAALTARVAKLEGQIVAADLVGTYDIHGIQNELSATDAISNTQIQPIVRWGKVPFGAANCTTPSTKAVIAAKA